MEKGKTERGALKVTLSETLSGDDLEAVRVFCAKSDAYSYLQDPGWPALWAGASGRHRYLHVTVSHDGDGRGILAYGVLRRTTLRGGLRLGVFRRGPITASPEDLAPALQALLPVLRHGGYVSLSVNPRWENAGADKAETVLQKLGGRVAPPHRQRLHSRTGLIDLSEPANEVLTACNAHTRRQFRKIEKLGLSVRPTDSDHDLALFDAWFGAFCAARGLDRGGLPSLEAQRRWVGLHGGDCAMVEVGGEAVGAFTLLRDGPRIFNLAVAWADPNAKLPRSYVVYWHAIRTYSGHTADGGPRWLDTAGLNDPRVSRPDVGAAGRERFKSGYPLVDVMLPRVHSFALRPIIFATLNKLEQWFR